MSTLESTPPTTERSALPVPERDDLDAAGHAMAAFDAETAAEFAERWRDGQLRAAARLIRKHDAQTTGRLPVEARNEVGDCFARADKNAERAERYRAIRDGHSGAAVVRSEPRVYGPDSPNSYYIDVARSVLPGTDVRTEAARGNLARYARELEVEVKADSAEGRRAKRATRSRSPMPPGPERRAMDSTSTSGGSFVTPIHLMDLGQYGLYNSYPPAVVSQSVQLPDPGYGLQLNIPAFSSAASVAAQSGGDGNAVESTTPSASNLQASLVTHAGEIVVSQPLFDRTIDQPGVGIDGVIHSALFQQLVTAQDYYAISQMTGVGSSVAAASVFSAAAFYGDVAKAKAAMMTAAGTLLRPSAIFMTPNIEEWLLAQSDPNGRPLLLPTAPDAWVTMNKPAPGYSGYSLLGLPVFWDANIPASSSNAQILLASMPEVLTLRTEPTVVAYPETTANDLQVQIILNAYTGTVIRHPAATQSLIGAAYPQSPTFS